MAQYGSFVLEKGAAGTPSIGNIRFGEGATQDGTPINLHEPNQSFKAGIKEVFAFYTISNLTKGVTIKREWYQDGKLYASSTPTPWNSDSTISSFWPSLNVTSGEPLPSGTYELRVLLDGKLAQSATFVIEP